MASRSHYDVLGVSPTASTRDIKNAYRDKARRVHPDRVAASDEQWASREMASLNEAWSVLSDPVRRRAYDDSLRTPPVNTAPFTNSSQRDDDVRQNYERDRVSKLFAQRPLNTSPAKFPWRTMSIVAGIGTAVVIVLSILSDPAAEPKPDQLLQSGSCVVREQDQSVREVSCQEDHYGVVRQLVGFDMRCPGQTESYRDRQGMGTACVEPVIGATSSSG